MHQGIPLVSRLGPSHRILILSIDLGGYTEIFLVIIVDPKKKSLYRVKYILRLSCARTLSHKHKSIVCSFFKRLGLELLEEFFTEEEQVLFLIFPRVSFSSLRLYKERIWYFDIICINVMANHK